MSTEDQIFTENILENFYALSESAFNFWNNTEDDIYQKYYISH